MKQKYYALMDDENKLILTSWDEAKKYIAKMNKPKYKSFQSIEEAQAFLYGTELEILKPAVFIDGSYDQATGCYSFGGVFMYDNQIISFNKKYLPDEYSSMRNVAGEIKGAGYAINYAVNRGIKELHIYYDYIGIEKWYTKQWKASSKIALEYVNFLEKVRDKINIYFHKIKSHTNNYYNDMADKLAKEALGI